MGGLSERLEQVQRDIGGQAEYLQHLLDQFELPYDISCGMQVTVDDLRRAVCKIGLLRLSLPAREPRRHKRTPGVKKRRRSA